MEPKAKYPKNSVVAWKGQNYVTIEGAARALKLGTRRIQILCKQGRLEKWAPETSAGIDPASPRVYISVASIERELTWREAKDRGDLIPLAAERALATTTHESSRESAVVPMNGTGEVLTALATALTSLPEAIASALRSSEEPDYHFLPVPEVAARLRVPARALHRAIRENRLHALAVNGRNYVQWGEAKRFTG